LLRLNSNIGGGGVQKKIAVLVRDRASEALRMSLGLILVDDLVDVYVLDKKLDATQEEAASHIEILKEMDMHIYTNCRENEGMEYLPAGEVAARLPGYDHILAY